MSSFERWLTTDRAADVYQIRWELWAETIVGDPPAEWFDTDEAEAAFSAWCDEQDDAEARMEAAIWEASEQATAEHLRQTREDHADWEASR